MKNHSTKILILLLIILAVLTGYNFFKRPFLARFAQMEQQLVSLEILPAPDPLQTALDELTPREKVLQMISFPAVIDSPEASISAELGWMEENRPGFITIFGSNVTASEAAEFTAAARFTDGYTPLIAVDHEGGTVQRLNGTGFLRLPNWRQICQMTAEERKALFVQSAQELNQAGVQIVFAPVVDIARPGSFLGMRACTTENEVVTAASAYITDFAQYGILPVIKHFPGIGSAASDLHFQLDSVELEPQDTLVFDRLLAAFPNIGVMTTHVVVPGRTDGAPCSLSVACLDRFPVNFPETLLFTDALEMQSAALTEGDEQPKTLPAVALQAVSAGNEVLVFGETINTQLLDEVVAALEQEYTVNENFQRRVNMSVAKILRLKLPQEEI